MGVSMSKCFTTLTIFVVLALFSPLSWGFQYYNLNPVPVALKDCSLILAPTVGQVRLQDLRYWSILVWNVENVMEYRGPHEYSGWDPKTNKYIYLPTDERETRVMEDWKFAAKQQKIRDAASHLGLGADDLPLFLINSEVETLVAGNGLVNTGVLKDRYRSFLFEGNDPRGIDIQIAVRSDLDVTVEMETLKQARWKDPAERVMAPLFSRDLPILIIRDRQSREVMLVLVGVHAKSQRDRAKDRRSRIWGTAQMDATARVVLGLMKRFGPEVPLILGGDLNRNLLDWPEMGLRVADEMEPLLKVLTEGFGFLGLPPNQRVTHTYHPRGQSTVMSQLGAMLANEMTLRYLCFGMVLPEFDHKTGELLGVPQSYKERITCYPSDHRALGFVLDGAMFRRGERPSAICEKFKNR